MTGAPILAGMASMADTHTCSVTDWLDLHEIMNVKLAMEDDANRAAERAAKRGR